MRKIHILRESWFVKQLETPLSDTATLSQMAVHPDETWLRATMPAQVHDVLLAHGRILDPHTGKSAAESAWIGEKDWVYATTFVSPSGNGPVFLRFDGVDTLAKVYVNGIEVGRCANMYRRYAFSVRGALNPPGETNILLLVFASPLRYVEDIVAIGVQEGVAPHHYLRKCHSDFGSYLGARPHAVKVGIFADVTLDAPDRAWFEDVWVRPVLEKDFGHAEIIVSTDLAGNLASLNWTLRSPGGHEIVSGVTTERNFTIPVDSPKLWWPRTHGAQPLYTLDMALRVDGDVRDGISIPFGIRRIRPVLNDPETDEHRFAFEVNGQRIFLRGACWAPLEGMSHRWDTVRATRLLDLVEHGEMNVIRVWGEGYIPPQNFYDACDRRGILIWQDFMFGYGMHPTGLPEFDANCTAEIADMLRRLRNHPCLLLWCGGNENHMGWDFRYGTKAESAQGLFHEVMPEAVARLDPDRLFHPSSPYGGRVPNWPLEGDWHDYTTLTFSPEASVPLYASEVGRASAPSLTSMRRFMDEADLWPLDYDARIRTPGQAAWPPMWQYRSVDGSWDKVGPIEAFCDPTSPADLIRVLGTAHGEYLQRRIERHRRGVPDGAPDGTRRCWGTTIWRLNDAWPILYWSAVDYYLEPKIPYYFLRRAYRTVLVSFERTTDWIAVWVVNDSPDPVAGTLVLRWIRFDGAPRSEMSTDIALAPGEARRCLNATGFGPINLRGEFLRATFGESTATLLLTGERYLHLPHATLAVHAHGDAIEITTDVFARQATLEMLESGKNVTGAVFEDNFFDSTRRTVHHHHPQRSGW